MAEFEPVTDQIEAGTLVVGGGITGMTTAIETAEAGRTVILVEKQPTLGGRVVTAHQYFPKLCPPTCGMEINLKRMRINPNLRVLTLAEVESISGEPGAYEVKITLKPRYINEKCTACGDCAEACEIDLPASLNGLSTALCGRSTVCCRREPEEMRRSLQV
jgi:quinone-modifying oxidoreductase subunit QmoA